MNSTHAAVTGRVMWMTSPDRKLEASATLNELAPDGTYASVIATGSPIGFAGGLAWRALPRTMHTCGVPSIRNVVPPSCDPAPRRMTPVVLIVIGLSHWNVPADSATAPRKPSTSGILLT